MLVNERRSIHEYQMQIEDYKRSNEDLKAEAGRHKLRVESKSFDACQFLINLIHLCRFAKAHRELPEHGRGDVSTLRGTIS